ncbi:MAG: hypothetical protein WD690_16180 [Vicinamibacterales bacterium]
MHTRTFFAIALLVLSTATAAAQDLKPGVAEAPAQPAPPPPPYKLSGLMFGDYYVFAKQHLDAWEGQHGLWLRRVYFTYDHTFTPKLSTRLRLEMNSNGKLAGGSLTPYVKDAYLRWNFRGRQALTLGIQPTLTFEHVEAVWGLRHIEKTPLDLYRVDSARDFGVTLSGPLNAPQTIKYAVQFGNESGNNAETDTFKSYRVSTRYEPKQGLTAEVMLGQFGRPNDGDRTTAQLFAGYRAPRGRLGAQYSFQKRRAPDGSTAPDTDLDIFSGFGVFDLMPRRLSAFVRADRYADPCPDCAGIDYLPIATTHPFTMTLAGLEYSLQPSVRFSPNVEWVAYSNRGGAIAARPANDAAVRLTFYWTF